MSSHFSYLTLVCNYTTALEVANLYVAALFLSLVSILTRDIDIANLSIRLSVRYVPVLYENGLTYCHIFFTIQ